MVDTDSIIRKILEGYSLRWNGLHGVSHWGRVLDNGLRLAPTVGADEEVVTLFSLFHDSRRLNDSIDPGHGLRGAKLAAEMRGRAFELTDAQFELLHEACANHTKGGTEAHPTVQVCWDADRLDLARAGITPNPKRLCTDAAKEAKTISWATDRALSDAISPRIANLWNALSAESSR